MMEEIRSLSSSKKDVDMANVTADSIKMPLISIKVIWLFGCASGGSAIISV
jgi:hypothetical protein